MAYTITTTVVPLTARRWSISAELYFPVPRRREMIYRTARTCDQALDIAHRMDEAIIEQAEEENARFDRARAYLARRADRTSAQLSLF